MKTKLIIKTIQSLTPAGKPYDVRDTELPGFLLRVMPTGGMAYFCDYRRPDGRRTRMKLGDIQVLTPAQARDEALKMLADRAKGEDPSEKRRMERQKVLSQLPLKEFIEKHYVSWSEVHLKTGTEAADGTLARFCDFKNHPISEITPWQIEKWRARRLKDGTSEATVNRNVTILKSILQMAVKWGCIDVNPLASVKPIKMDRSPQVRFLDPDEEHALRDALDKREERIRSKRISANRWRVERGYVVMPDFTPRAFADRLKPMVLLSINLGVRRGELFSLERDHVDLERRMITVTGGNAKSGNTRHIPLNMEAFDTLSAWIQDNDIRRGLIFPGIAGRRLDHVNRSWRAVLALANIQNFRWHDMRHHFASMLVMNGVDLNTVRELLGHGDLKMTLRYAHLAPQIKADAVAKLDAARASKLDENRSKLFLV